MPFLLLPLLTRILNPEDYGLVVVFMLMTTLCQAVAGFNAHAAMGVFWFRKPQDELSAYFGGAIFLALSSTIIVGLLISLGLYFAPMIGSGITPTWGLLAAVTAGSVVILNCRLVTWQNQHRALSAATLQFLFSLINVGLSLALVLVFSMGAAGRNLGIALSAMMMAAIAVALLWRSGELRGRPQLEHFLELIRFGAPLTLHTVGAILLSSADRWSVAAQLSSVDLGIYGAGAQLGAVVMVLGDAFVKAYAPWLYARLKSGSETERLIATGAIYVTIPFFLLAASFVGLALYITSGVLLGPQYGSAMMIIPWFMLGGALNGIYLSSSTLFFYHGRTGLLAGVTLSSGIVGATISWLLVARAGLPGAAIGFAATQAFLGGATLIVSMRTFDLNWGQPLLAVRRWFDELGILGNVAPSEKE